jgi:hypothetical protein
MRTFVVPYPSLTGVVYEVDFLSRHELVKPLSDGNLPDGWEKWGVVKNNQLFITDVALFTSKMIVTADAFIAIPTYRFDGFVDDVDARARCCDNIQFEIAISDVLLHPITGYSYIKFLLKNDELLEITRHSILELI